MGSLSLDTKEKFIGLIKHLNMNRPNIKPEDKVDLCTIEPFDKQTPKEIDSPVSQTSFFDISPSTTSIDSSQIQSIASNSSLILHDSNSSLAQKSSNGKSYFIFSIFYDFKSFYDHKGVYNMAFLDDCNYDLNIRQNNNEQINHNNSNNNRDDQDNQLLTITSSFQPSYEKLNSSEMRNIFNQVNDLKKSPTVTKQQKIYSYKNTQTEETHLNTKTELTSSCHENESDDDLFLLVGKSSLSSFESDERLCSKHKKFKLLLNNYNILKMNQMRDKSDKTKEEKVLKRRQSLFLLKQKRTLESLNRNGIFKKNQNALLNERSCSNASFGQIFKRLNCFQIMD